MAPKSKGRVVDMSTFLPEEDIANLSVEYPTDGRSGRRYNDRYGTYGIGDEGGRRDRRRDDEDSSRADADMEWRRGGAPARTDSRPMGGMRREGGSGGDFGGGFRPRNAPGNDIEISRSGLSRSDMSRGGPGRPPYGGAASTESRPGFAFGGDRGRMERNRSQDEPEGEWRSSKPAVAATPTPAAAPAATGQRKRFNFGAVISTTDDGAAAKKPAEAAPAKDAVPPVKESAMLTRKTESPPSTERQGETEKEEPAAAKAPATTTTKEKPSSSPPKPESPREVEAEREVADAPKERDPSPPPRRSILLDSEVNPATEPAAPEAAAPTASAAEAAPAVQPSPTAAGGKPKINFNDLWSAPRQARPAPRAVPTPAAAPAAPMPRIGGRAAPAAASEVTLLEEPQVEKKKKRVNEKKAALRAARAKKVETEGRRARSDIVRRNLIRGCAQDIDSICSALDPIISAEKPLDVEAAGAELDKIVGTLQKTDSVWDSTLLLACVHVVIVKEIAAVAEDLMAMEGWSEYTPAQIEAAVDEKLVPEAETCVRNATPVLLAAKQRLEEFLGQDFEFVNLQEMIKSVAKSGCPRLTPSLTITELVLIAWLTQSPEIVTPELVVEWSDDPEDDTEGRMTALAQMVHLVKWLQGGIAEDKGGSGESEAEEQEESDED